MCRAHACARRQVASSYVEPVPEGRPTVGVEREPRGRQVGRRVARRHVAEVDHRAQRAVVHEQVGRVRVAVQPERRTVPRGRVGQVAGTARGRGPRPGRSRRVEPLERSGRGGPGCRGTGSPERRRAPGGAARAKTSASVRGPGRRARRPACGARRRRRTTGRRSTPTGRSPTGTPTRTGTGHVDRQARGRGRGATACSCATSGAATARTGNRAARSSPIRHSALSQPVPAQVSGQVGEVGVLLAQQRADELPR